MGQNCTIVIERKAPSLGAININQLVVRWQDSKDGMIFWFGMDWPGLLVGRSHSRCRFSIGSTATRASETHFEVGIVGLEKGHS